MYWHYNNPVSLFQSISIAVFVTGGARDQWIIVLIVIWLPISSLSGSTVLVTPDYFGTIIIIGNYHVSTMLILPIRG